MIHYLSFFFFFLLSFCLLRRIWKVKYRLKILLEFVLIPVSSVIVCSGKRGVHHGIQQISALSARHTRGTHPQVFGSYRAAASKEEQVEELRSSTATGPSSFPCHQL